jgi:hypothetical protein
VDRITFAMIEAAGLETWLSDLRMDLAAKTYTAAPVRSVMILKPGGRKATRHPDNPGPGGTDSLSVAE